MLDRGAYASVTELAEAEKINQSYVCRVLRLNLLAPDIVESALNGTLSTQHGRVGGLSRRAHGQTGNPFG